MVTTIEETGSSYLFIAAHRFWRRMRRVHVTLVCRLMVLRGSLNAITDVPGVTVGHSTVIEDYENGSAARTGVTAILPRGEDSVMLPAFAGTAVLNGAGEMTGTIWVEASGFLEGPVMITTTQSVGIVFEETIKWRVNNAERDVTGYAWSDPVVAETWGGTLNDENGFYVTGEHVAEAIEIRKIGSCRRKVTLAVAQP